MKNAKPCSKELAANSERCERRSRCEPAQAGEKSRSTAREGGVEADQCVSPRRRAAQLKERISIALPAGRIRKPYPKDIAVIRTSPEDLLANGAARLRGLISGWDPRDTALTDGATALTPAFAGLHTRLTTTFGVIQSHSALN